MREMRVFPATLGASAIVTLQSQFALAIEAILRLGNFPPAGCGLHFRLPGGRGIREADRLAERGPAP